MMDEGFGQLATELHAAEPEHGNMVLEVEAAWILALVGHARLALKRLDRGDIHIVRRAEALGIGAEVHFVVVQGMRFSGVDPRFVS